MFCPIFAQIFYNGNNQKENRPFLDLIPPFLSRFLFCLPVPDRFLCIHGASVQYDVPGQGPRLDVSSYPLVVNGVTGIQQFPVWFTG